MSRNRVRFLRKQLQRNQDRIGRIRPISEWVPAEIVQRWLNGCCEDVTSTNLETGEITLFYILSDEAGPNRLTLQLRGDLMARM